MKLSICDGRSQFRPVPHDSKIHYNHAPYDLAVAWKAALPSPAKKCVTPRSITFSHFSWQWTGYSLALFTPVSRTQGHQHGLPVFSLRVVFKSIKWGSKLSFPYPFLQLRRGAFKTSSDVPHTCAMELGSETQPRCPCRVSDSITGLNPSKTLKHMKGFDPEPGFLTSNQPTPRMP
jgi:hypothetical protein